MWINYDGTYSTVDIEWEASSERFERRGRPEQVG